MRARRNRATEAQRVRTSWMSGLGCCRSSSSHDSMRQKNFTETSRRHFFGCRNLSTRLSRFPYTQRNRLSFASLGTAPVEQGYHRAHPRIPRLGAEAGRGQKYRHPSRHDEEGGPMGQERVRRAGKRLSDASGTPIPKPLRSISVSKNRSRRYAGNWENFRRF